MTRPLSFDHLQAILRQHTAGLPDARKPSPNTRYTIQNAALGAFGIFFMQSPSFLEYQRQLNHRQGHDNAQTLFGVEPIPCDNQIRTLLDPIAPRYFHPVFFEVFAHLEQQHWLDPWRVLDHQLLVALDGTQYFSSKALHCQNCLTRQLSNGQTLYYHTAITPVIVCPGHAQVIALAPEYIMPQDGHAKQDCEQAAGKRWLTQHASTLVPHHVTLLGDDLYSKAPFCALALHQGFNFILVCKPDSHPKFYDRLAFWQAQGAIAQYEQRRRKGRLTEVARYRFINEVLLQDGKHALAVHWVEMTVVNAKTGEQLYYNTFITNHRLSAENVAQVAQAGRGRWKIENENNNVLK
ncbi:MAG TPA: ISNCY family transposase, partial [Candidatus Saccharimonadia bacterium]|nr:ISNCY family transposase [Candidatus Saccharimonadia bacterium]